LIRVPHPFNPGKTVVSAFVVRRVYHPVSLLERPTVEWFSQDEWRANEVPSRPEYLIRKGGTIRMRDISAVLELAPPYLAFVKRTHLITGWDDMPPRRKKRAVAPAHPESKLLKSGEVVKQKDNFRRALMIQAKKIRDAPKRQRKFEEELYQELSRAERKPHR
jgi:hypothetical protein